MKEGWHPYASRRTQVFPDHLLGEKTCLIENIPMPINGQFVFYAGKQLANVQKTAVEKENV